MAGKANPTGGREISGGQWAVMAALAVGCAAMTNRFVGLVEAKRSLEAGLAYASEHLLDPTAFPVFSTSSMGLAATICAAVIPAMLYMNHLTRGTFRRGEEHGSARFADLKEIRALGDQKVPMGNVLLSKDAKLSYKRLSYENQRNRNILVVGGSGSGKTRGYVKPNLMQVPSPENLPKGMTMDELQGYARSYIVTDPKGTTRMECGQAMVESGYDLKEFNVVDWSSSMHFNPIAYLKNEADVQSFATCFIRNTTPKGASSAEPFWENSERKLYEAVINYMIEALPPEQRNLPMMCELLDMAKYDERNPGMSGLDILFYELETGRRYNKDGVKTMDSSEFSMWDPGAGDAEEVWKKVAEPRPNSPAVRAYRDVMSGAPETIQSILISVKVRLGRLRPKIVSERLEYDELQLDEFGDRKMVLFAVPHDQDDTYNFLIAIIIWLQLKLLSDRALSRHGGSLPVGVDFILDEAGNFYIPQLENTVATCRSRNIGVSIILQSNAQLKSRYGDDAPTIVDCCDTLVFLGGKSQDTTKQLEEIIGQQTVTTDNTGESKGTSHSMSTTIAQHGRALMQASEIAHMRRKDCLVLVTSTYPWIGPKFDVEQHPMYAHIDPGHDPDDPRCPRHGFDTSAYLEEPGYFEAPDAELSLECAFAMMREAREEGFGLIAQATLSAENAEGAGPALNFGGEVTMGCSVLRPAADAAAADKALWRALARAGAGHGLSWAEEPARATAAVELNRFSGRHMFEGTRIEPGQGEIYRFELSAPAPGTSSIEELAAGIEAGARAVLRVSAEVEVHCATCDVACFDAHQDFAITLLEEIDGLPRVDAAPIGDGAFAQTGRWGYVEREGDGDAAEDGPSAKREGLLSRLGSRKQ